MSDRSRLSPEAADVVQIRSVPLAEGCTARLGCRFVERAGLDREARRPGLEPFRTCIGLLLPGDGISLRLETGTDERAIDVSLEVLLQPGRDRESDRPAVVDRALAAALAAAYPGLVFEALPDAAGPKRWPSGQLLSPEAGRLSAWQARAIRDAPQLQVVRRQGAAGETAGGETGHRQQIGSRLALTGTSLLVALQSLARPVGIEIELSAAELSAAELRQLGAAEQRLCEDIRRPDDPLLDTAATEDLARMRIITRSRMALKLKTIIHADLPLRPAELDLVSTAIFDAPAARGEARPGAADLASLLPRSVGAQALEHLLTSSLSAALELAEAPRAPASTSGTLLGTTKRGAPVRQDLADRSQHTYMVGATGTGKSTLLLNMIAQDMEAGEGLVLIDPHGDLFHAARALVPRGRRGDLVIADAAEVDAKGGGFTLNVLQGNSGDPAFDRNAVMNDLIELFRRTLYRGVQEAFGPMFEVYFRNAGLLLMSAKGDAATILDFERVFQDEEFRDELIGECDLQHVVDFWRKTAERVSYADHTIQNMTPYITCKLAQITTNERMRPILGGARSSIDFCEIIANRRICLVNLAKAQLGEKSAAFLGGIMLSRLCMAALAQGRLPKERRVPASIVLDEFHTFATDSLPSMLAETRKFGFRVTLANQSVTQIDGRGLNPQVLGTILGNVANVVAFRCGIEDADAVGGWFQPAIPKEALTRLPNFEAVMRLIDRGEPLPPLHLRTLPPPV
jgi:DNA helicase HerA-like ATPase